MTGRRLRVVVVTLAVGLGIWGAAFTFTSATFADGDVLSAAGLNQLLNDNFQAASDAVAGRLSLGGGSLTGTLDIEAAATSGGGTLLVQNSGTEGSAGVFTADTDTGNGALTVKQSGAAPALSLKAFGTGDLVGGANASGVRFVVENDGSVRIGALGADGTDDPNLMLGADGTIANLHGSSLPLAYGFVSSSGVIDPDASTDNFSVTWNALFGRYEITIDGVNYSYTNFTTVVTPATLSARMASTNSMAGDLLVRMFDSSGSSTQTAFHFVVFKPGS